MIEGLKKLILASVLLFCANFALGETTKTQGGKVFPLSAPVFDDKSCSNTYRTDLCCYGGYRYDCSFLNKYWFAGYCRKSLGNGQLSKKWTKCNLGIPDQARKPRTYNTPRPTKNSDALPYAAALTSCAGYGKRKAGRATLCAKGVRHSLTCMARKLGQKTPDGYIHCGIGAYDYYGKSCLEKHGFRKDMSACDKPGVIRVYYGYRHKNPAYKNGDRYGHIEFKGIDGQWHAAESNRNPIDVRLGKNRRILKACYVLPGGRIK